MGHNNVTGDSALKCMYTNSDQLINKRDDLCMAIAGRDPEIILISEVIPKAQVLPIAPALLSIPGYSLFTSFNLGDSNLGRSGRRGVAAYIRDGISAAQVTIADPALVEHIWLQIKLKGSDLLLVGCVYRSPSSDPNASVDEAVDLLNKVCSSGYTHILIAGDFNLPLIDWANNFCSAPDLHYSHKFLLAVQDCFLFQHVTRATRFRDGEQASLLDLLLTNEEGMLTGLKYLPGLGKSDHVVLEFHLVCYTVQELSRKPKLNFNRGDFSRLRSLLLDTDWDPLVTGTVDEGYKLLKGTLDSIVSSCVPLAKGSHSRKNIYMTGSALQLRKEKNILWMRAESSSDPLDMVRFRQARNRLRSLTRSLRVNFEMQLVSELKTNSKAFWRYSNTRLKTKPRIGDIRDASGLLVSDARLKAEALNQFFASVFTHEDIADIPAPDARVPGPTLCDLHISPRAVDRLLTSLKVSCSPGPDDIHPRVLSEAHSALSVPFSYLFRRSLDTGCIPSDWSLARVVPIHKKGSKSDPSNYRPVSLTAVPCKVMEALVRDELLKFLMENELLSCHQYGFRPGRSCSSQLIDVLDEWSRELECANPVDVIYLDFRKAFDSVPHQRLLSKLRSCGVSGKLLAWIECFLTRRKQRVIIDGTESDWANVTSGVPQGSVLGPLLFLIYVNDIPDAVQCTVKLFADDTKLYSRVRSPADAALLQADLQALARWSDTWLMPFNQGKCTVLHIGRRNHHFTYMLGDTPLASTQLEKDLGINVDAELKFREHAASAVAKATQLLAVIRRSFALIDESTLPLLYKTVVRPHLEYGNLIWGPFNRADQRLIERVQRRATRLVQSVRHRPYVERLRLLQLPSLYYRRRRGDMIFTYQLFHGGIDADPGSVFTLADGITRGHPFKLQKLPATTRVRRSVFAIRVVNDWNGLPTEVVCAPSVNCFKSRLDAHWAHIRYSIPDTD